MENASKALIIAGGILFALMTLALFVYMATATTRFADEQDKIKLAEQIAAFNNEYEAYNKRRMYGAEIITIVNKAIDHNKRMAESNVEDPYYVNIKITTKEEFETTVDKIVIKKVGEEVVEEVKTLKGTEITETIKGYFKKQNLFGKYFGNDVTSELGNWDKEGKEFIIDSDFKKFFESDKYDESVIKEDVTYIMYSALKNFKRAIFTCTDVEYNEKTGRIKVMSFEQIKL